MIRCRNSLKNAVRQESLFIGCDFYVRGKKVFLELIASARLCVLSGLCALARKQERVRHACINKNSFAQRRAIYSTARRQRENPTGQARRVKKLMIATNIAEPIIDQMMGKFSPPTRTKKR